MKADMGPDPVITYLSLKQQQHQTSLDKNYVDSVFDSYSVKTGDDSNSAVTKGNAILAYDEIFKMWKVDLNLK